MATSAKVDALKNEGLSHTKFKLSLYWSKLPSELPALTSPITSLSEEELQLLEAFKNYKQAEFTTLTPQEPQARENPFN